MHAVKEAEFIGLFSELGQDLGDPSSRLAMLRLKRKGDGMTFAFAASRSSAGL